MADTAAKKEQKPTVPDEDVRYRFIGFEVFSKKTEKFWRSDEEMQKHIEKARSVKSFSDWDRDFSAVKGEDIAKSDRIVLTASNIILLGTMFMPWISYRTNAGSITEIWFSALGLLGVVLGGAFEIGNAVGLAAIFGLVVFICTPLLAVMGLVAVYLPGKNPEAYVRRLRLILRLNYVGMVAWFLGVVFSLAGGDIAPLTQAGLLFVGESFTVATLFKLISYGAIVPLGMFFLNALKSNEL